MENKTAKTNTKINAKNKSVRISLENQKKAEKILALANKKKLGRRIKLDHVLAIALDLLTDEHIRKLQDQSLSNEDRKEQLRQRYIEIRGPISRGLYAHKGVFWVFSRALANCECCIREKEDCAKVQSSLNLSAEGKSREYHSNNYGKRRSGNCAV